MICCKVYFNINKVKNLDEVVDGLNEIGDLYCGADVIFFKSLFPKVNKSRLSRELNKYGIKDFYIQEIERPEPKDYDSEWQWVHDYYNAIDTIKIEKEQQDKLQEMKAKIDTVLAILQNASNIIQKGGAEADGEGEGEGDEEVEGETEEEGTDSE